MSRPGFHHPAAMSLPNLPRAACKGMEWQKFVPPDREYGDPAWDPEPARAVCWLCPEREPCLRYALANVSLDGMWGATTAAERHAERVARTRLERYGGG